MRSFQVLSLVFGLQLAVSSAGAVTVFSVTGAPASCLATGGGNGNQANGIVTAKSWTQTQGYTNVSISAALQSFQDEVTFPNFTVYLTTSDGPGTTTAQEIAHATVTAPVVNTFTSTLTTLFTGLTLPPGSYVLTIFGDPNERATGPACWTLSTSPVITTDNGVSNIQDHQVSGVAPYPPASSLGANLGDILLAQVTGDPITSPVVSKAFGKVSLGAMSSTSLSFTLKNPNTSATLDGLTFSDALPTGLVVSTPNGLTGSCGGGTITAVAGTAAVSLTGATLAAGASCTFSVNVTNNGLAPGLVTNTTSTVTSNEAAPGAAASATLFLGDPFLVSYAANLNIGESFIDITNVGANGAPISGPGFGGASGNICANVYAFDSGEELVACCSCLITPDETVNLGVNRDLTVKTLTGVVPNSVTIKVLATLAGAGGTGTSCTNSAASVGTATLVNGAAAWGTTLHATPTAAFATTERAFTGATLSAGELASLGGRCSSILGNGSSFGVCSSCKAGALGAGASQQ